jgi:hypothetical protein
LPLTLTNPLPRPLATGITGWRRATASDAVPPATTQPYRKHTLLQDGDVEVGVFPEREEVFISGERTDAAAPAHSQPRCSADKRPKYWKAADGFPFIVVAVKRSKAIQVKAVVSSSIHSSRWCRTITASGRTNTPYTPN